MTTEITMMMHIPVKVRMTPLKADDEAAFVDKCIAAPGACDNDLSEEENREWFRNIWRQQVRFQQLLLADSEHLAKFITYIAAEEITSGNLLSKAVGELEGVIEDAAQELGAVEHFDPPASMGLGSYDMLAQVIDAIALTIDKPTIERA
jgi:hypothetical protein